MFEREHAVLLAAAVEVLSDLRGFHGRLLRARASHVQHDVFAERARSLSIYLSSAQRLAQAHEYVSAFAVLRSALEHHLTDRLLFLGKRYRRQYAGVKKADFERLENDWKLGRAGTEDIVEIRYSGGTMWVVRSGLHVRDGAGQRLPRTLSIYYFLLEQFDPFVGRPQEQSHLSRGFMGLEHRVAYAKEQQQRYAPLRWSEIKENLGVNRLCSTETLRRFEVHYRFLSAFVHPVPAGYDLVYGRDRLTGTPRYDHYASELVLLYINKFAAAELRSLKQMAGRTPRVRLDGWECVEAHIRAADDAAAHLWFPGVDQPHAYDRVEEANSRGVTRGRKLVPMDRRLWPDELRPDQVRYYRNPLRRLIQMHQSFQELTGFAYISPWPRDDARFR